MSSTPLVNLSPGLLLAHPTGNANVRAAANAFHQAGWLREFHSCICLSNQHRIANLLPSGLRLELQRRSFPDLPPHLLRSHAWREMARLASGKLGLKHFTRHETGTFSVDQVFQAFDRHVATALTQCLSLDAVYAYEDAALATFQAAHRLGIKRIYELPIGYWKSARQILVEEAQLLPEWASTLTALNDSPSKLARKDAELEYADVVIVASSFVRHTLECHQAYPGLIHVLPYGAPPEVDWFSWTAPIVNL